MQQSALSNEYRSHPIFEELKVYSTFYKDLSFHVMNWMSRGTGAIMNLDTYVYSSVQGTLESISSLLRSGRINDAYALLRKYFDSTIINVYTNLYLDDNFSVENFVVKKIDDWRKGKDRIPEYRVMSQYIKNSPKLSSILALLHSGTQYKDIRDRCNDHTHYNYYENLLFNDNEIYLEKDREKLLDKFSADARDIFVQHLAYIFLVKENYMMSSDYTDALEVGMKPDEEALYYVAPFIQEAFNTVVIPARPDVYHEIKSKSTMILE
jgi:hypothetical protein